MFIIGCRHNGGTLALTIIHKNDALDAIRAALVACDPPASLLQPGDDDAAQSRVLTAYAQGFQKALLIVALALGLVPVGTRARDVAELLLDRVST